MMNSIVIDGTVVGTCTNGCFDIVTSRQYYGSDGLVSEENVVPIQCLGDMATQADELCTDGRLVRVIGRLKTYKWSDGNGKLNSKIVIVAEHIEFKDI